MFHDICEKLGSYRTVSHLHWNGFPADRLNSISRAGLANPIRHGIHLILPEIDPDADDNCDENPRVRQKKQRILEYRTELWKSVEKRGECFGEGARSDEKEMAQWGGVKPRTASSGEASSSSSSEVFSQVAKTPPSKPPRVLAAKKSSPKQAPAAAAAAPKPSPKAKARGKSVARGGGQQGGENAPNNSIVALEKSAEQKSKDRAKLRSKSTARAPRNRSVAARKRLRPDALCRDLNDEEFSPLNAEEEDDDNNKRPSTPAPAVEEVCSCADAWDNDPLADVAPQYGAYFQFPVFEQLQPKRIVLDDVEGLLSGKYNKENWGTVAHTDLVKEWIMAGLQADSKILLGATEELFPEGEGKVVAMWGNGLWSVLKSAAVLRGPETKSNKFLVLRKRNCS